MQLNVRPIVWLTESISLIILFQNCLDIPRLEEEICRNLIYKTVAASISSTLLPVSFRPYLRSMRH